MSRLGFLCFPGTGHLNPLTSLGRRLRQRGHQVTIFQIADVEPLIRAAGLNFIQIGQREFPRGTLRTLDRWGLQNGIEAVFRAIAEACSGPEVQLVISLGGGLEPEDLGPLAGNPIVVRYAPQLDLMRQSALVISHGGLNTVLEALTNGVPLVIIPVTNDQPGIGARVQWTGSGEVIPLQRLSVAKLRRAVHSVLENPRYRSAAQFLRDCTASKNGLERASDIVEQALAG